MKVILLKNVDKLGEAGVVKEVAEGYARNFLFPQKLAEIATKENINRLKDEQVRRAKLAEADLLLTEKIADKLNGAVIEFFAKINEAGKLYAAVTPPVIVKELKKKSFDIKKEQIILLEPIKEVGEYNIKINLDHGLEAEITLIIKEE